MRISWTLLTVKTATTAASTPSQIEADDCFYGFGEKSGELNKAQKYMVLSPEFHGI